MTRILIIEDEVMIAEDLAETCRSYGYDVLEPAFSPGDALIKLNKAKIDLVILDINLASEINGIEIASYINEKLKIPFIYLTSYSDSKTLLEARLTKPMAYITKPFKRTDIFTSIEIAIQNYALLSARGLPSKTEVNEVLVANLTEREYEILTEIHNGKSNQDLSELYGISINTVKSHLKNCYAKLGVNSRVAALSKLRQLI